MLAPKTVVVSISHDGTGNGRASKPQIASTSAVSTSARPTVTSTCSIGRRYSGRISTSSTSAARTAPTAMPATAPTSSCVPGPPPTCVDTHHVAYAPTVRKAPWAKLSTPMRP